MSGHVQHKQGGAGIPTPPKVGTLGGNGFKAMQKPVNYLNHQVTCSAGVSKVKGGGGAGYKAFSDSKGRSGQGIRAFVPAVNYKDHQRNGK